MTADDAADIEAALRELAKHGRVFALRLESLADLIARAQMPGLTPRPVTWEQAERLAHGGRDPRGERHPFDPPTDGYNACYALPTCFACLPPPPDIHVAVGTGTVADVPREAPSFFEARASVVANLAAAKLPRARKPAAPWEPSATSWQRAWASAHIFSADKAACVASYLAACPTRHVKPGDRDFVRWVRETSGKMDAAKAAQS